MLFCENLSYAYPEAGREHHVLRGVNLELAAGERVALVGSSGSGKSTLLNVLSGIDKPSAGHVKVRDIILNTLDEPDLTLFRRQHIGFVYQQFNLIPTLTVAENVLMPLELLGVSVSQQRVHLDYWLHAVRLAGREQAFPDQLSGGEQQRVAIARALIHQPELVLADEPTGNLDAATGELILDLLFDLVTGDEQTLLVVTHSQSVAERADRVMRLYDGRIANVGYQAMAW